MNRRLAISCSKDIRVASFFAGCGGLDLGFVEHGYKIVYATDFDEDCVNTLKKNRGLSVSHDAIITCEDIRSIDLKKLPKSIDLVIGGPPCQSFSASGRRAGGASGRLDERGNLFKAYRDIIDYLKPKAFLFENVRGIFATNKGDDWKSILNDFKDIGYLLSHRLLDAADYGIPQHRERVFLLGQLGEKSFLFPEPTHGPDSKGKAPYVSPRKVLKNFRLSKQEKLNTLFEGGKYSHLLSEVPEGQNYLFFTAKRGYPTPIFAYRSRFSDFLYKAHPDYPMKTIIASPGKYTGPLHWKNRYFSVDEYKVIQGFPKDYKITGNRASQIRQIGNSVSPMVAKQLANAIAKQVFGKDISIPLLGESTVLSFDKRKAKKARATRVMHQFSSGENSVGIFCNDLSHYTENLLPRLENEKRDNVELSKVLEREFLRVFHDTSTVPSLSMRLSFWNSPEMIGKKERDLTVELFGTSPDAIQLMWNAIDSWVRKASSLHSMFEAYGHFTEPYPLFKVEKFEVEKYTPIFELCNYLSDFNNCSKYLLKSDLLKSLGKTFKVRDFPSLARKLRALRFDVRTRETNIAIPPKMYMIAYPFTLPNSKQMNFSFKEIDNSEKYARSYIEEQRMDV